MPAPRGVWATLLAGALPGALPGVLAGLLTVGLVYFLNINLPLDPTAVARAAALYGSTLGAASALVLLLAVRGRRERRLSAIVWTTAAVLGAGAALYWAHASRFAYYLPTGINQRLLKTGFWLACAGLGSFYIALTHSMRQRAYGWRARAAVVAFAAGALLVVVERRVTWRPAPAAEPTRRPLEARRTPRLCVIGLDSASLDALLPLAEQGQVPTLAALLQRGSYARLKTLSPTWRLPAWTTLATGKYPFKHGLLSQRVLSAPAFGEDARLRLLPQWMGFEVWGRFGNAPAASDSAARRALALWEIGGRATRVSTIVAWPGSAPLGVDVGGGATDRFFAANGGRAEDVTPVGLAADLAALRRSPQELGVALRGFGEKASAAVLNVAAADHWRAEVALALLSRPELGEGDLWLFLRGLGSVSARLYGGYAAARQEGSREAADLRAAEEVTAYYRFLDTLLERVLRAGQFDLVAVVSAHGVNGLSGWRRALALLAAERSLAGRADEAPDGLLLLEGPGVRPGAMIAAARIVDVVPTLLYSLGMPLADDLDGRVLTDAFSEDFLARQPLSFLPTYERARP